MKQTYKIVVNYGHTEEVEGDTFTVLTMPKQIFGLRKENRGWVIDHLNSGMNLGTEFKTKQDAQEYFHKLINDPEKRQKILSAASWQDLEKSAKEYDTLVKELESLTGEYFEKRNGGGFTKGGLWLDRLILPVDRQGKTLQQAVIEKWGEKADEIILKIIETGCAYHSGTNSNLEFYTQTVSL